MRLARPRKDGVDYFPFDVDFFNDSKVKIVRSRYGSDGVEVYIYLLCEVYRDKGYYLQCNEDTDCLIAADLGMSIDKVGQIKAYLLGRSLFDDTLFRSAEVLSSRGIQRRFQQAVKGRAVKNPVVVRKDLWLLDESETESFIKVRHKSDSSENNPDNSKNNPSNSENNTTNQSKVNKSKSKHSKSSAREAAQDDVAAPAGASLPTDPDDIEKMIIESIERDILGRHMNPAQQAKVNDLMRWYDSAQMLGAVEKTRRAGGRSIEYIETVLRNNEYVSANNPAQQGMYTSSYDMAEVEALLDEDFYSELEDNNEQY